MTSERRHRHRIAAALLGLILYLGAAPPSGAQRATRRTLAEMDLAVIPRHHQQMYFFYGIGSCDPNSGNYLAFQLNSTGDSCPETKCIPSWLGCNSGGVAALGAGTTRGTVVSKPVGGGWISYQFAFQVDGAYTQIWDAAQKAKVADGFSRLSFQVAYDLTGPIEQIPEFFRSVLGPIAHGNDPAFQALGLNIRGFTMKVNAQGSGQVTVPRAASWHLTNVYLFGGGFAVGSFNLVSR